MPIYTDQNGKMLFRGPGETLPLTGGHWTSLDGPPLSPGATVQGYRPSQSSGIPSGVGGANIPDAVVGKAFFVLAGIVLGLVALGFGWHYLSAHPIKLPLNPPKPTIVDGVHVYKSSSVSWFFKTPWISNYDMKVQGPAKFEGVDLTWAHITATSGDISVPGGSEHTVLSAPNGTVEVGPTSHGWISAKRVILDGPTTDTVIVSTNVIHKLPLATTTKIFKH